MGLRGQENGIPNALWGLDHGFSVLGLGPRAWDVGFGEVLGTF